MEVLRWNRVLDKYDQCASLDFITPVPRYRGDLKALEKLTEPLKPPKRVVWSKNKVLHVEYGFLGDASGKC